MPNNFIFVVTEILLGLNFLVKFFCCHRNPTKVENFILNVTPSKYNITISPQEVLSALTFPSRDWIASRSI